MPVFLGPMFRQDAPKVIVFRLKYNASMIVEVSSGELL